MALLHDYRALFVVPGLPNADDGPVCLDLVDIASFDPDVLHLRHGLLLHDDGLLHDYRLLLHDDWLGHHRRLRHYDGRLGHDDSGLRQRSSDDCPADDTADEARPEVATAAAPVAMVVVYVHGRRPRMPMAVRARERACGESRSDGEN